MNGIHPIFNRKYQGETTLQGGLCCNSVNGSTQLYTFFAILGENTLQLKLIKLYFDSATKIERRLL